MSGNDVISSENGAGTEVIWWNWDVLLPREIRCTKHRILTLVWVVVYRNYCHLQQGAWFCSFLDLRWTSHYVSLALSLSEATQAFSYMTIFARWHTQRAFCIQHFFQLLHCCSSVCVPSSAPFLLLLLAVFSPVCTQGFLYNVIQPFYVVHNHFYKSQFLPISLTGQRIIIVHHSFL